MFNLKKSYFYGEGTDHIVKLTKKQARAINGARVTDLDIDNNRVKLFLPKGITVQIYNTAAGILNEYLKNHSVSASEEFLAENDILRPTK